MRQKKEKKIYAACHECRWAKPAPTEPWAGDLVALHKGFTGHKNAHVVVKNG